MSSESHRARQPYLHDDSGTVRFWVPVQGNLVGASVRRQTLHYCYRPGDQGEDPMETYALHAPELEVAVQRRVAQGSIEPVMLREFDLRATLI